MITLENVLHRFEQFATAHLQIKTFSHGQITDLDIFKNTEFPVMHVVWNGINTGGGTDQFTQMVYNFQILFLDQPHIQDNKTEQAKFAQSDCVQYGIDLLAAIQNGEDNGIFNDDFVIANASFDAVTEAFSNVLWGASLNLGLQVDLDYNLCDAPLDDISGGFTPCTLCGLIADSTALQIVQCLSEEQEAAISALICEASGTATYSNGGAFEVEIDAGDTYTADPITVTDVDGTERPSLPNIGVVCEWKTLQGVDSEGAPISSTTVSSYPAGGNIVYPDRRIEDANTGLFQLPYRNRTIILNAVVSSAVNDTPNNGYHNLTVEVDVPVVNSAGDSVGGNVDDLLNPHPLPDLPVTDNNGAVGTYPMPTSIVVSGQVNTASYSGGVLTIDPQGGGSPTAICPAPIFATQANLFGETGFVEGAQIAAGVFDPPTGAFAHLQGLDYTAAIPFVTLKHSHLGGTARWRDSANDPLTYGDATVGDGLVTDLNFDRQWYIVRATVANFQAALDYAAAATFGGHSDWRLPIRAELWTLFDLGNTDNISFPPGRTPGFDTNSTNSVVSCTTAELGSTFVYATFGTNRRTQFVSKSSSVNVILIRNFNSY